MMSDHYIEPPTGFEGTASDHLKEEIQAIQIKLRHLVGDRLRSINFWINARGYRDDPLDGSFELTVAVEALDEGDDTTYKHTGPTLDAALDHVLRHIVADLSAPEIASGNFHLPKLIAAQ
jgi:hypothetical protein